ncbi:MAG: hypothetical protein K0S34_37 [Bacillales bacterium]|jgi:hypothetical protein|nr:hypothetical protein [Bacillales bacterium]
MKIKRFYASEKESINLNKYILQYIELEMINLVNNGDIPTSISSQNYIRR